MVLPVSHARTQPGILSPGAAEWGCLFYIEFSSDLLYKLSWKLARLQYSNQGWWRHRATHTDSVHHSLNGTINAEKWPRGPDECTKDLVLNENHCSSQNDLLWPCITPLTKFSILKSFSVSLWTLCAQFSFPFPPEGADPSSDASKWPLCRAAWGCSSLLSTDVPLSPHCPHDLNSHHPRLNSSITRQNCNEGRIFWMAISDDLSVPAIFPTHLCQIFFSYRINSHYSIGHCFPDNNSVSEKSSSPLMICQLLQLLLIVPVRTVSLSLFCYNHWWFWTVLWNQFLTESEQFSSLFT